MLLLNFFADNAQKSGVSELDNRVESVAELLKDGRFGELVDKFFIWGIDFMQNLLIAIVVFLIGRWIIKKIKGFIRRLTIRREMDTVLQGFVLSTIGIFLYVVLFVVIIDIVGIKTVSIAALIGSAGLAIGLAVKDNLANFAGGVMLLLNKPFKGGDYIQTQNLEGTVKKIGILYTTLTTVDNKTLFVPNGPLSTGSITNFNAQSTRRVDIPVSVDYGSDVENVKKILLDIASKHQNIQNDPEPFARMVKMNQSSIDFTLRVWVKADDYWSTTYDLTEEIYKQFKLHGMNIPFPQMTVHLTQKKDSTKNGETP